MEVQIKKGLVLFSPQKPNFGLSRSLYMAGPEDRYIKNPINRSFNFHTPKSGVIRNEKKLSLFT